MKKVIFVIALTAGSLVALAQAISHNKWEENNDRHDKIKVRQDNEFANTEMTEHNRVLTFTDLPQVPRGTWAYVTDANGGMIFQRRISPRCNTMDIHRLAKGELYFVTLVYQERSQKAFVLNL